jgi:hypothetical protein
MNVMIRILFGIEIKVQGNVINAIDLLWGGRLIRC